MKNETGDIGRLLFEQANALNDQMRLGLEHGKAQAARDMQALFKAYDLAQRNPDAKIPTALHMAIEYLRQKYVS